MGKLNLGIFVLSFFVLITSVYANLSQLTDDNGSVNSIGFDSKQIIDNLTFYDVDYSINSGSESYYLTRFDEPRRVLEICHENLTNNHYLDMAYFTHNYSDVVGLFNLPQQVSGIYTKSITTNESGINVTSVVNCSSLSLDLAVRKAFYPGSIVPVIYIPANGSNYNISNMSAPDYLLTKLYHVFNGSYKINIRVLPPQFIYPGVDPKRYGIFTEYAYDELGNTIPFSGEYLMTSVLDNNNSVVISDRLSPMDQVEVYGSFKGGETIFVNDIESLNIKVYEPCSEPLTDSGYYILNNSMWDVNRTCVEIENVNNLVLNFVGEVISGNNISVNLSDNSTFSNSSMAPGVCSVRITNARNISIESINTNQFYTGLCIENSSVNIFGDGATYNVQGALITGGSHVGFYNVTFQNENAEILAFNGSSVYAEETTLASAVIRSNFTDIIVRSVLIPPPYPEDISNDTFDLGQFVQFVNTSASSWADIAFHYNGSLPNNVSIDKVSIWKYNGTFEEREVLVGTNYNATTNQTVNVTGINSSWVDGDWIGLLTYVSPYESLIIAADRITTFSVFAPFSDVRNATTEPEPDPQPKPEPKPSGGGSSGGGSVPSKPTEPIDENQVLPLELELELPEQVIIHQGEVYRVPFNLTNIGDFPAFNISVGLVALFGWDVANSSIDSLYPGNVTSDDFLMAPSEKAVAKDYFLPVHVYDLNGVSILSEILKVVLLPRSDLRRIRMLEYPQVLEISPSSKKQVSFLVENMGEFDLENIRIEIKDNDCLEDVTGKSKITSYDTGVLTYGFYTKDGIDECKVNAMFYNADGVLVGFAPLTIKVAPTDIPVEKIAILLLILLVWTVLTALLIMRRFNSKD